jgi:hypothetical protein
MRACNRKKYDNKRRNRLALWLGAGWCGTPEDGMRIAIFLAAVTIGLSFAIGIVANCYGPEVGKRFLERREPYTAETLKTWVTGNPEYAKRYAFPVLFPLDLLFMIFLGAFLGVGSVSSAESLEWLKRMAWLFAILPALYVAVDLIEDVLLARLVLSPENINESSVALAKAMTTAKFWTSTFGILQTVVVSAAAALASR